MNNNNKHIYTFIIAVAITKIFFSFFIELGNDESNMRVLLITAIGLLLKQYLKIYINPFSTAFVVFFEIEFV